MNINVRIKAYLNMMFFYHCYIARASDQLLKLQSIGKIHTVQNIAVGVSLNATLASPKSHILSLQSALAKIFFGFKSRWKTFAA